MGMYMSSRKTFELNTYNSIVKELLRGVIYYLGDCTLKILNKDLLFLLFETAIETCTLYININKFLSFYPLLPLLFDPFNGRYIPRLNIIIAYCI